MVPDRFREYSTTSGVAQESGESGQKLPGIFVWRPIEVEDAQQLGGVGKSGESRKKVPGNFLW